MLRAAETESFFAAEGTKAHALGELEANLTFGKITPRVYRSRYDKWLLTEPVLDDDDLADMTAHVEAYIALITERMSLFPNSEALFEVRVDTGVESCWGTSDTVIVSPQHVEVIDLKYGRGIPVSAVGNSQLRLYGVGALDSFGDVLGETEVVRITVFQPRLNSTSTEEITPAELRAWRDSLIPIAAEALRGTNPRFGPSDKACRWCAAAGECRARIEKATREDFGSDPELISLEELGTLLDRLPGIRSWCTDVEDAALRKAYSEGEVIPGWKVAQSGGQRKILDQEKAIALLLQKGFPTQQVASMKLKGIGDLEKLLKSYDRKSTLEETLGDLVVKTPGKPSLVHEDDARPSISPNSDAVKEFS